ncbi:aromatic ring-hydroxylating dioxygenase subunit alpha [Phenylobacterium sp.]|uniref:aromatic ring-hydroxylating oxygenase subunit alpha n=1 Tax=Phenylobacterium sp. TaxID=1871053 RepID=UPI0035B04213
MFEAAWSVFGGVADRLEQARALPGAAYVDPEVFAGEVRQVMHAGWAPVARVSDLAKPGDYRSVDLAGAPLVAVHDASGTIQVLSRACRHRGMPVVEGSGNAKAFTCPYHLWRYGLDGRLAAAPAMDGSEVFDRADCALPKVATELWGGWVFANVDGRAPPLAPRLAPLAERLAAVDPASLVSAGFLEFDSPWNWKLMVENFLESYHHIGPHAQTLQLTNPGLGTYESLGSEAFTVLENPPVDDSQAPFSVAAAFPLTLMSFVEDGSRTGVWYEMDRIRADGFLLRIHLLAPPDVARDGAFAEGMKGLVNAVHLEDIAACAGAQSGMASPLYEPGPLSRLEAPLWRFHRHLRACFGN